MINIHADILAQLRAKELRPFWLLTMALGTTVRYTDCDVPIATGGNTFNPRYFKHGGIKYSIGKIVDSISVELDNIDQTLSTAFIGGDPQGSDVTVQEVVLNSSYAVVQTPVTWFQGTIDDWEADEDGINMKVVGPNYAWSRRLAGLHPSSCRWPVFKGTECTYAGGQSTCDRSYARCASLTNTNNFGGFRWLPSIEGKEIVWGRTA